MNIKNRISKLRSDLNLTQEQLAIKIGVQKATISKYENGKLDIPNETLIKLSNIFNCSTDYILGNTNLKIPENEYYYIVRQSIFEKIFPDYLQDFKNINLTEEQIKLIHDYLKACFTLDISTPDYMQNLQNFFVNLPKLNTELVKPVSFFELFSKMMERFQAMNLYSRNYIPLFEDIDVISYLGYITIDDLKDVGLQITEVDKKNVELLMRDINSSFFSNCKVVQAKIDDLDESNVFPIADTPTSVPVLGKISAGLPLLATENIEGYEFAPSSYIKKGFEYFYLRVTGDSMNLKFNDGDIVLVQKQDDLENDEIGVILVDGMDATVKKYKYENGLVILSPLSTNSEHAVQIYNPKDISIKIVGKVVSYQGKI